MIGIIKDVLEYFKDANLHSESAREGIAEEIIKRLDKTTETDYGCTNEAYEKFLDEYEGGHLG